LKPKPRVASQRMMVACFFIEDAQRGAIELVGRAGLEPATKGL
jgi:hypothetical protein